MSAYWLITVVKRHFVGHFTLSKHFSAQYHHQKAHYMILLLSNITLVLIIQKVKGSSYQLYFHFSALTHDSGADVSV